MAPRASWKIIVSAGASSTVSRSMIGVTTFDSMT